MSLIFVHIQNFLNLKDKRFKLISADMQKNSPSGSRDINKQSCKIRKNEGVTRSAFKHIYRNEKKGEQNKWYLFISGDPF